jgi:hypothetical protein
MGGAVHKSLAAARMLAAVLYVAAVVVQLIQSLGVWATQEGAEVPFLVAGFFSYFTMETGIAAAVVLALSSVRSARGIRMSAPLALGRGLVAAYAATTAIAYNVLLRPIEVPDGSSQPLANEWLHTVGPIVLLIDWALAPDRRALRWRSLWAFVAFPILWAAYTFLRGPVALDRRYGSNWYPYPFLNPDGPGGYGAAMAYVGVLTVLILALASGVVLLSRRGSTTTDAPPSGSASAPVTRRRARTR